MTGVGLCALVGALLAAAGQLASPLHLPTHELTQSFSLVAAVFLVFFVGRAGPERRSVWEAIACVLAAGAGAYLVEWVATSSRGCRLADATAFFWITWLPLGSLAALGGRVAAERGLARRRLAALVVVVVLASLLHDALQALRGCAVVDPLVGIPEALNQRAEMAPSLLHVYQRGWLALTAATLWAFHRGPRAARVVAAAAWLAVTFGAGSHVGVGWGRGAILSTLSATHRTEHFTFRYAPDGRSAPHVDAIGRRAEWVWRRLDREWGLASGRRVEVSIYDGPEELARRTGIAAAHAGPYRLAMTWYAGLGRTLEHEIVHAYGAEWTWNPLFLVRRGLVEGTAIAFDSEAWAVPAAHEEVAGALDAGHLPPAAALMSPLGFWSIDESNAYDASGSFVGWLIFAYGAEKMAQLHRSVDFEGTYGKRVEELDREWRAFLGEVPLDPESAARAGERFDPELSPSFLASACPKLGERTPSPRALADRFYGLRDYRGALSRYDELTDSRSERRAAQCLQDLGEYRAALERVSRVDLTGAAPSVRDSWLGLEIDSRVGLRDWDGLYAAFDVRRASGRELDLEHEMLERALRREDLRELAADVLSGDRPDDALSALRVRLAENPEDEVLSYLVASWVPTFPLHFGRLHLEPSEREKIHAGLRAIEGTAGACDHRFRRLLRLVDELFDVREYDTVDRVLGAVELRCEDPLALHEAAQRRRRLEEEAR